MKKLLLTSDSFANPGIGKRFLELVGKDPAQIIVLFIATASRTEEEILYVRKSEEELMGLGILKPHIVWASDLKDFSVDGYDAIYVCGGNTFHLLHEIRRTGFDKKIIDFINNGGVYVGVSAGSIIMGPDISIAAPFDENDVGLEDFSGLNIIKSAIAPHYQRKERAIIDAWEHSHAYKVLRLNDGQAVDASTNLEKII
jgi:dipeptidase E